MIRNGVLGGKSNRGLLLLALFFGVVFALLVTVYLARLDKGGGGGGETGGVFPPVVVAAENIAAGTKITEGMLTLKTVPSDVVLPDAFEDAKDVVGKVALYPITAGEQVLRQDFAAGILENAALAQIVPGERQILPCEQPNPRCGLRGLSVAVAEVTAGGGLIRAGDHVDVILALQDASAITLVQDVEVLAIGEKVPTKVTTGEPQQPGVNPEGTSERQVVQEGEQNPEAVSATLAVWPEEAQVLVAAEEFGKGVNIHIRDQEGEKTFDCRGTLRLTVRNRGAQQSAPAEARVTPLTPRGGECFKYFLSIWGS